MCKIRTYNHKLNKKYTTKELPQLVEFCLEATDPRFCQSAKRKHEINKLTLNQFIF